MKADVRPRLAARLQEAEDLVRELIAFIGSLDAALRHLDALPDRAGRCDPQCGFLATPSPSVTEPVDAVLATRRHASEGEAEAWRTTPVACSLNGAAMTERAAAWQRALEGAVRAGIPDGLRLTLPAGSTASVAELAAAEHQCCPFFDFRFHIEGQALHFEVRAPSEGAELLADLFGPRA